MPIFNPILADNKYPVESYAMIPLEMLSLEDNDFSVLTLRAVVLYSLLFSRAMLSLKKKKYNKDGEVYVFYSQREIRKRLRCSITTSVAILKELENFGLISRLKLGCGKNDIIFVKDYKNRDYVLPKQLKDRNST